MPNCWQGWAALGVWTVLAVAGSSLIVLGVVPLWPPRHEVAKGLIFLGVMVGLWTALCFRKGERPFRWRWGEKEAAARHCDQCGYNLTGNVSGVCPECGERIQFTDSHGHEE